MDRVEATLRYCVFTPNLALYDTRTKMTAVYCIGGRWAQRTREQREAAQPSRTVTFPSACHNFSVFLSLSEPCYTSSVQVYMLMVGAPGSHY